jgi:cobalt-zinc-cadmium efflux system outer membrane protein
MHRVIPACLLAICASAAAAAQSPGAPVPRGRPAPSTYIAPDSTDSLRLSRAEAVALARTRNPQLAAAREQIAEARANRVQSVAIPDPAATASLDQQPGFFRSAPGGQKNIGATLAVPFPDKFRLNNAIGVANIQAAQASYTALAQQIAAQTSEQYDSLLVARRHRVDLLEARQLAQDFLVRTNARFQAGTAPRLDVIRAQVDLAAATNDLIANQRDIVNASAGLDRLIGRPVGAPVAPTDSLDVPPGLPALDALQQLALQSRPELAGAMAERRGAASSTTLAREFWLPDVTFGFTRNLAPDGGPGQFSTGLAFPIPVLFWQHTRGEVAFAQHRERELAATYRDLEAAVAQDVRTAYASASTALQQLLYIRDQLLPSARAAYRAAAASYAIGGSSAFEVIDARRTLLDAESQYADALANANTARTDLERAVSVPLATIPAQPVPPPPAAVPDTGAIRAH